MAAKPEWEDYRVTSDGWGRQPLVEISHVAHLLHARRILEDDSIRAGLVFDKSKLRESRARVVWLSPNDWSDGFRYGNVRFTFDWPTIIDGCRVYWVEAMKEYNPHAPRLLVTTIKHPELTPYDPAVDRGPWIIDGKDHLWNGDLTLEVMVERDWPLSDCKRIDFVRHHDRYCAIEPGACRDQGRSRDDAAARFAAWLSGLCDSEQVPERPDGTDARDSFNVRHLDVAWGQILVHARNRFAEKEKDMGVARKSGALARACFNAVAADNKDELRKLVAFFGDSPSMEKSLRLVFVKTFPRAKAANEDDG